MNARATMTSKGQITIPALIRERLNLKPGDRVDFIEVDGNFLLKPRKLRAADLAGILHRPGMRALTIEEMNEAVMDAVTEDDERITRQWHEGRQ